MNIHRKDRNRDDAKSVGSYRPTHTRPINPNNDDFLPPQHFLELDHDMYYSTCIRRSNYLTMDKLDYSSTNLSVQEVGPSNLEHHYDVQMSDDNDIDLELRLGNGHL